MMRCRQLDISKCVKNVASCATHATAISQDVVGVRDDLVIFVNHVAIARVISDQNSILEGPTSTLAHCKKIPFT